MTVSPFLRPLGIVASILGTLQGLTWTVLSLLVILLASKAWIPEINSLGFNSFAYALFFEPSIFDATFNRTTVLILGCISTIISFIWTISSMILIWVFLREKYNQARLNCFCWTGITVVMTIFDLIVTIILAVDLGRIYSDDNLTGDIQIGTTKYICSSIVAIAMTISARGFVLLIINPLVAFYLFKYAKELTQPNKPVQDNHPFISAYQNPAPSNYYSNPLSPGPRSPSNHNQSFMPDEDPLYHRSVSQLQEPPMRHRFGGPEVPIPGRPLQKPRAPQPPPSQMQRDPHDNYNNYNYNARDNLRDNPRDRHENGPDIPAPDYDNPRRGELERMPRSALRTKSYY